MDFITGGIVLLVSYLIFMVVLVTVKQDTSIANFTWGGGCMLVALYTIYVLKNYLPRPVLLTSMIVIWAIRLIIYLYQRYTGRDPRFEKWKMSGAKAVIINIGYIFFGQLVLLIIMSIPVVLVNTAILKPLPGLFGYFENYFAHRFIQPPLNWLDYVGLAVWIFGFIFETISDSQLFQFLKKPGNRGHVMQYGLWRYSRHPNYFGEAVLWWGVFLIALNVPNGILAIVAPITITFLLRFVSGVRLLENAMKDNREYQEYKKHTNVFIPWFNK